jgi:hypothetical protein
MSQDIDKLYWVNLAMSRNCTHSLVMTGSCIVFKFIYYTIKAMAEPLPQLE